MCDTAIITAPDCSMLSRRSWCLTTSAKFSPMYVPLAGDFLDDKHSHRSWHSCFKRLRDGMQFKLSSCASWPGGAAGTPWNTKAVGSYLEFHTLFAEKSTSPPEVCLNLLYHKEPSPSRLLPWMPLCEFLQQGVKWRKMPQSICDRFSQQETIFGSLPRVAVNFWRQWWKLRKHKAFVEDLVYYSPLSISPNITECVQWHMHEVKSIGGSRWADPAGADTNCVIRCEWKEALEVVLTWTPSNQNNWKQWHEGELTCMVQPFPDGVWWTLGILLSLAGQEELGHQRHTRVCSLHRLLTHPSLGELFSPSSTVCLRNRHSGEWLGMCQSMQLIRHKSVTPKHKGTRD